MISTVASLGERCYSRSMPTIIIIIIRVAIEVVIEFVMVFCDRICDSACDSTVGSDPLRIVSTLLQFHLSSLCADAHGHYC